MLIHFHQGSKGGASHATPQLGEGPAEGPSGLRHGEALPMPLDPQKHMTYDMTNVWGFGCTATVHDVSLRKRIRNPSNSIVFQTSTSSWFLKTVRLRLCIGISQHVFQPEANPQVLMVAKPTCFKASQGVRIQYSTGQL